MATFRRVPMRVVSGVFLAILLTCPRISGAQTTAQPASPPRAFVELNLVGTASSSSDAREFRSRFVTFGEIGTARATYPKPSDSTMFPSFDVGAGYITGSLLGLGINIG